MRELALTKLVLKNWRNLIELSLLSHRRPAVNGNKPLEFISPAPDEDAEDAC
jgi:hypothetical protein